MNLQSTWDYFIFPNLPCLRWEFRWKIIGLIVIFSHLKLCLPSATHNFKWLKIIKVFTYKIWIETYASLADLTLQPPNYSIWIFNHLKLCLADAIHNFKWVKIMQIWQNGGQLFSNRDDWCHIMASPFLKGGTECGNN